MWFEKQEGPSCWINVITYIEEKAGTDVSMLKLGLLLYPDKNDNVSGREYYLRIIAGSLHAIAVSIGKKKGETITAEEILPLLDGEINSKDSLKTRFINRLKENEAVFNGELFNKEALSLYLRAASQKFFTLANESKDKGGSEFAAYLLGGEQAFGKGNRYSDIKDTMDSLDAEPPFYISIRKIPNYEWIINEHDGDKVEDKKWANISLEEKEEYMATLCEKDDLEFVKASHAVYMEDYDDAKEAFWIRDPNSPKGKYTLNVKQLEETIENESGGYKIRFRKEGNKISQILD